MTDNTNFKDEIKDAIKNELPLQFQKLIKQSLSDKLTKRTKDLFEQSDSEKNGEMTIVSKIEGAIKSYSGSDFSYKEGVITLDVSDKEAASNIIDYLESNPDVDSYDVTALVGENYSEEEVDLDAEDNVSAKFEFNIYIKTDNVKFDSEDIEEDFSEGDTELTEEFKGAERYLLEAKKEVVFRGAKKVVKMACPPGQKWNAGLKKCVRMTAQEVRTRHVSAIKASKKRAPKMRQIAIKRAKSMKKRISAGFEK